MNLEVIKFLLEHGADRAMRSKTNSMTALELAQNHCASPQVKQLLLETIQIFFHPKIDKGGKNGSKVRRDAGSIILDDTKVKVGCCGSLFYFCKGN